MNYSRMKDKEERDERQRKMKDRREGFGPQPAITGSRESARLHEREIKCLGNLNPKGSIIPEPR